MHAIKTAQRGSAAGRVGLPHPMSWAVAAVVLGVLAVTVLVSRHPLLAPSHPLLEVSLGHDGVRLGVSAVLGLAALAATRRFLFALMAAQPGPIEALPLTGPEDASRAADETTSELCRSLTELRLAAPSSVPGNGAGESVLQAVRAMGQATNLYGALAAATGLLQVPSAYRVSGELRQRPQLPCFGVTVRVHALPAGPAETETVWANSWAECTRQGAHVVGAYVLPRTRLCRRGPWAEWRGRRLHPELSGAYQQAQSCMRERRYEEALEHYEDALRHDPRNTP